jgi:hypothetical protein
MTNKISLGVGVIHQGKRFPKYRHEALKNMG